MFDQKTQARINKSCTDAAVGYTQATMSFYSAFAAQSMAFWSEAAKAASDPAAKSHRTPDTPAPTEPTLPFAFWNPAAFWMSAFAAPTVCGGGADPQMAAPTPFQMWWTMPFSAQPASWPIAYQIMASGVPHTIAWPTAEANVATMDAVNTATESINRSWNASYRSDSGHAVAPAIQWGPLAILAITIPLTMMALLPLLSSQARIFTS